MKKLSIVLVYFFTISAFCSNYQSLIERSPFCSRQEHIIQDDKNVPRKFELHGIFVVNNEYLFSIRDVDFNKYQWIKLGDKSASVYINKYKPKNRSIEFILSNGEVQFMKLKKTEYQHQPVVLLNQTKNTNDNLNLPVTKESRKKFLDIVNQRMEK